MVRSSPYSDRRHGMRESTGRAGRRLAPSVALLLFDCPFSGWNSLETSVRDWLTALDRQAEGTRGEPRLGAIDSAKLLLELLKAVRIELILVEVLRTLVPWLLAIRGLLRICEPYHRLLDAGAFQR